MLKSILGPFGRWRTLLQLASVNNGEVLTNKLLRSRAITSYQRSLHDLLSPAVLMMIFAICAFVTVLMSYGFYVRSVSYPPCANCDATLYGQQAHNIQTDGLFKKFDYSGLRTYGYPLFISAVTSSDALVPGSWAVLDPSVPVFQTLGFIAAVGFLGWSTFRIDRVLCAASVVGLLTNPFVVVYLSLRLTEGLVISLWVVLAAIAIRTCNQPSRDAIFCLAVAGSLIAGFSQVTRPSCLPVLIAWLVLLTVLAVRRRSIRVAVALAFATIAGLSLTLAPQIIHNAVHFDKYTFFPAYDLSGFQIAHGLESLKHHTLVSPSIPKGGRGVVLPNPFLTKADIAEYGFSTYLAHPIGGLMTATMHVLNSINHDYFYVYLSTVDPRPYALMNAVWHFVLFMGVSGAFVMLRGWQSNLTRTSKFDGDALATFLSLSIMGTLAVNSVSAVETRFGVLIFLLAGPLSIWRLLELRTAGLIQRLTTLLQGTFYAVCASTISTLLTLELVR